MQLEQNITSTIGVPFEMIVLDNTVQKQNINYVYNQGAGKASFDIICFVHEDIVINTPCWGKILLSEFEEDPKLGLVGLAGSKYKSHTNSGWYTSIKKFDCCLITHLDASGNEEKVYSNPEPGSSRQQVVVIDGVFMCTRKSVWAEFKFDADLLKGFHFYDIDYSFRVSRKYVSIVSFEIEITHLTYGGDFGDNWIHHSKVWHDTYSNLLPFSCLSINASDIRSHEVTIARTWLNLLMKQKVSFARKLHWLNRLKFAYVLQSPLAVTKFMIYDLFNLFMLPQSRSKSS